MVEIGKRVKGMRKLKNMSQIELEKRTGIKREYLSKIENQELKNPTYRTLCKLSDGLGIPLPELISENTEVKAVREPVFEMIAPKDWSEQIDNTLKEGTFTVVPVISQSLAVKTPEYIQDKQIEEFVFLPAECLEPTLDSGRYRGIRLGADDESMAPCFRPGSLVVLDSYRRDPRVLDREMVILRDKEDNCMVREIRMEGKTIIAIPLAIRDYPPLLLNNRQNLILGKVIWGGGKFS